MTEESKSGDYDSRVKLSVENKLTLAQIPLRAQVLNVANAELANEVDRRCTINDTFNCEIVDSDESGTIYHVTTEEKFVILLMTRTHPVLS